MKIQNDRQYFVDMKIFSKKIIERTQELSVENIKFNEDLQLVLERLFENLGESANRFSVVMQTSHSEIPWSKIILLRNKIAHGYDVINFTILLQ